MFNTFLRFFISSAKCDIWGGVWSHEILSGLRHSLSVQVQAENTFVQSRWWWGPLLSNVFRPHFVLLILTFFFFFYPQLTSFTTDYIDYMTLHYHHFTYQIHTGWDPQEEPRMSLEAAVLGKRAPLPHILLVSVQSLGNMFDDLRSRAKFLRDIQDWNLLCFTETWLNPAAADHAVQSAELFLVHCVDRIMESVKSQGDEVCLIHT